MKKYACCLGYWMLFTPLSFLWGQNLQLSIDTVTAVQNNPTVNVSIKALFKNQPWQDLKADNITVSEKIGVKGAWVPLQIQNIEQKRKYKEVIPQLTSNEFSFIFLLDVSTAMTPENLKKAKEIIREIVERYSIKGNETFSIQCFSDHLKIFTSIPVTKGVLNVELQKITLDNREPWLRLKLKNFINQWQQQSGRKNIVLFLTPGIDQSDSTKTPQKIPSAAKLAQDIPTLLKGNDRFYLYPIALGDSADVGFLQQLPLLTPSKDDEFTQEAIPQKLSKVISGKQRIIVATHLVKVQPSQNVFRGEPRWYKVTNADGLSSQDYTFRAGKKDEPIYTSYRSPNDWMYTLIYLSVILLILAGLLGLLVFALPVLRKKQFVKRHVKPYRIEGGRRHRDQLTNLPIEEGEPTVYKCSQVTTLQTWIDFGWQCPNYPNCLNNPQFRCGGAGAPVRYRAFFDMQDPFTRLLNWLLFGTVGGYLGATIFLIFKEIEYSSSSKWLKVLSEHFESFNNALVGACFGAGLLFMLSWVEERGQSRKISWLRILLRTFLGVLMSGLTFLFGYYLQEKVFAQAPLIGSLLTWLLFGLGIGLVLSVQSSIPLKRALLGGLISGLLAFLLRLLLLELFRDYILANVVALLSMGAMLGYTLLTIISIFEDFEIEYLEPSAYYRKVSIGKWLQGGSAVSIGTAPDSNIYIKWKDDQVVALHAQLNFQHPHTYLTAFAETLVNNVIIPLKQKTALQDGDIIQLGRSSLTKMRYFEKRKQRNQPSPNNPSADKADGKGKLGAQIERK